MKKFLCWVLSAGLLFPPALVSSVWAQDEPCHMSSMLRSFHEDWHRAGCVRSLFSYFAKIKMVNFLKTRLGCFLGVQRSLIQQMRMTERV